MASRREIERMIAEGRIALDGNVLDTPATLLTSLHGVTVDGKPVAAPAPARLFRYHKPAGLLTTEHDPAGRPTIYDRLPQGLPRVMPVGRLDLNTEGLLLLTTDGGLKRELELPATGVERSYRARAYGQISQPQLEELMLGVKIEGVRYGSINANIERRTGANVWIEMTLTEGKNREVRRVLEYLGLEVNRLIRTRYGPFWLGDLPAGDVDEIRQHDLITFRTVLAKPGGGKAASNLQFAVRARVPEPAPKPQPVVEPDRRLRRAPVKAAPHEPKGPRFTPRATPPARGEAPIRQDRHAAPAKGRKAAIGRPAIEDRAPAKQARFTPRGAPAARAERPAREETGSIAKPARAARARAHRDQQEPRAGEFVDRPRAPRPTKGPAGGRGKPARPGRPPRTRK
ncbi:pseudouridine synthase [Sphingomonas psychrotolerans]|uniref:Pseudouridine synthase n=1 Tax=Sphingomonas psychrotolerans TaxID=1327635 RepID=A0ABU3N054_9SPHN|nr:pseudouridine synthase [Sphingomonas psychrotolerans]